MSQQQLVYTVGMPGENESRYLHIVVDDTATPEEVIRKYWELLPEHSSKPLIMDVNMYPPEGQKKEPGTFIRELYTYDGLGIPYGGEIFHRHKEDDRFYFWLNDTTRGRRKAFIDETAPAMQRTLTDLKHIWAQYGEQKK